MAQDASEIVVGAQGSVNIAPFGTTLPDGTTAVRETLDAAFIELGLVNEDGVAFTDEVNVTDLMAWQSLYPVRRLIEGYESTIAFVLMQWNKDIWEQVFSGTVTETVADTVRKFTPTRDGVVVEKSLVIDWDDGVEEYRLVVPRVGLGASIEVPLTRTGAAEIPTEWGVVGDNTLDPWFMLTSDDNFDV